MSSEPWPMALAGVDRIQHAIRRIVLRAMPTIPGMAVSPVTIAEIVTDALRDLDTMQAEYAARRDEHVQLVAEAKRLERMLTEAEARIVHLRTDVQLRDETIDRLRGSVAMLDREVQRHTMDREQLAALERT